MALAAHGFVKIPLIEAFINTHNFYIICLSETFLDSTIPQNDENINIKGYSLRADHPGNSKRGGVCLYYKEYLLFIARNDISCMQECLVTELSMNNEKCFFTCLYRSPSQIHEELDTFAPEKLSTFNTLLKYEEIEFWSFIEERTNTRRKKLQTAPLRKDPEIYAKKCVGKLSFL